MGMSNKQFEVYIAMMNFVDKLIDKEGNKKENLNYEDAMLKAEGNENNRLVFA